MEVTDNDKHFSFLRQGINYDHKNLHSAGPRKVREMISCKGEPVVKLRVFQDQ